MKLTKRLLTLALALVLVFSVFTLVACADKPTVQEVTDLTLPTLADNQVAVIIKNGDKDYTNYVAPINDEMKNVEDVLNYLAEELDLYLDWQDSDYGKYLNGIGGAIPTQTNEFVSFYTSVADDKGNWAGVTGYTIGDVEIVSAQVGVSSAKVESGAVYYFEIGTY